MRTLITTLHQCIVDALKLPSKSIRTLELSVATLHECIMDALKFQSKSSRTLQLFIATQKSLQGALDNHFARVITVSRIRG